MITRFTRSSAAAFLRTPARARREDLQSVMMDDCCRLCVSDGCILVRLFSAADLYPDGMPALPTALPVFGKVVNQAMQTGELAASARRAEYHGDAPILPDDLRKFCAFARRAGCRYPLYPVGRAYVNPSLLADVLAIVPDARIYADPHNALAPLYFSGARADGILCPVRADPRIIRPALELLATWRGEDTPLAADLAAAEEAKKDYEAYRARLATQQAADAEEARRRAAEEAAQAAQEARQHADSLADLRRRLQSVRGSEISVDGALLVELMESCGVAVPGRAKGWIRAKLHAVVVGDDGTMTRYRWSRSRKGERGSESVFTYVDQLLQALPDVPAADPLPQISMPAFQARFAAEYQRLYDSREPVPGYEEALAAFDAACKDENFLAFVRRFAAARGNDPVSSDRECVAFMFALAAFQAGPSDPDTSIVPGSENQPEDPANEPDGSAAAGKDENHGKGDSDVPVPARRGSHSPRQTRPGSSPRRYHPGALRSCRYRDGPCARPHRPNRRMSAS